MLGAEGRRHWAWDGLSGSRPAAARPVRGPNGAVCRGRSKHCACGEVGALQRGCPGVAWPESDWTGEGSSDPQTGAELRSASYAKPSILSFYQGQWEVGKNSREVTKGIAIWRVLCGYRRKGSRPWGGGMQGRLAGPSRGCGLVLGHLPLAMALANHGHVKEADLQESAPEKAQPGRGPTSTLLWIFSLSGHLVLSQDSSF